MKRAVMLIAIALILTGCADHITFVAAAVREPVGFWFGLWHGTIMPFAWLISIFDNDVSIYAIYNNGGWYNFGFVLGAAGLIGGGASWK